MLHLVSINDESETGKSLIKILQKLAKQDRSVTFLDNEPGEVEDDELLELMNKAESSAEVSEREVFYSLSRILKK